MFHFAVCDDEPFMVQELSQYLTVYLEERRLVPYSLSSFADGRSLLDSGCDFDLIFLDIQLGQPDGMETAAKLRQQGSHSLVIFVTVLKERVFDAFAVQAFDYLVKPLDAGRFWRTMDRAAEALKRRFGGSILIQRGSAWERIPFSEIVYCEVQGRKLYIHRQDGAVIDCYGRLEALEKQMDSRFFKCHRSYLVNLDCVRGSAGGQVTLLQGGEIPVSRLRERDFTQALLRQMKKGNA